MTEIIFDENEDWEKRILCDDESCIGTIGPDGKCKECGKVYEGERSCGHGAQSIESNTPEAPEQVSPCDHDAEPADDWDERVLCRDESCIGVIGTDGKCKECGKPL
jgi:hypothetical protein